MPNAVGTAAPDMSRLQHSWLRLRLACGQAVGKLQGNTLHLLLALLILAAMVGGVHAWTYMTLAAVSSETSTFAQQVQSLERDVAARTNGGDFLTQLPSAAEAAQTSAGVTAAIYRQALAHDVTLSSLATSQEPLSAKTLAHNAWALELRGSYPHIKAMLAEVMNSNAGLRVIKLKFQKLSVQELEAQVTLVQWISPSKSIQATAATPPPTEARAK